MAYRCPRAMAQQYNDDDMPPALVDSGSGDDDDLPPRLVHSGSVHSADDDDDPPSVVTAASASDSDDGGGALYVVEHYRSMPAVMVHVNTAMAHVTKRTPGV